MGAIPSTLHVKVKFRTEHNIAIVRGNQKMARQCLVTAVNRKIKEKKPADETLIAITGIPRGNGG